MRKADARARQQQQGTNPEGRGRGTFRGLVETAVGDDPLCQYQEKCCAGKADQR